MEHEQEVLAHCNPEFAKSWRSVNVARPLLGGFIDAMALVEFKKNGCRHRESI